jgi:hypothetical protein
MVSRDSVRTAVTGVEMGSYVSSRVEVVLLCLMRVEELKARRSRGHVVMEFFLRGIVGMKRGLLRGGTCGWRFAVSDRELIDIDMGM